ncbi:MAG: SUMF1/EgtB/PvdO family nonheme iron enzyme [Ferruginibacter sp.]
MSHQRQLAAILFADIAGYTALMEHDELKALQFREKLKLKLEAEVAIHNGKIIKWMGDGVLCSFDSAIESVRTAMALQLSMHQEPKVPLRIGIHQADVIFESSDVHGDGVNIASRLESLALPGSIFISAKVYDDIKNQKDIQTRSLGKYILKNVAEPVEIFAISNHGLVIPGKNKLEGKGIKYISNKLSIRKRSLLFTMIGAVVIIAALSFWIIPPILNKENARNKILPAIQKLVDENFRPPTKAYDLAIEAEKYIPKDSALIKLWPLISTTVSIRTMPSGAEVYWKDYNTPGSEWRFAGTTPLESIKFPRVYLRMEFRKKGFQTIEYAGPSSYQKLGSVIDTLVLDPIGSLPENMVRIPNAVSEMQIVGLEQYEGKSTGDFFIDKFEVSNKLYKTFVEAGGYADKKYWHEMFLLDGKEVPWETALALFKDRTGRPGPANWEAGTYPNELENHPVTGISWYEAAAYAAFTHKQLPTIYHWARIAETSRAEFIIPLSNFNGRSTTPVGSMPGYNTYGIYDIAGNAREWCMNESNLKGQRFVLGGGWNEPTYSFNDGYTQNAMDRSIANGFRCIKTLPNDTFLVKLTDPAAMAFRDYHKEKPVDDKTFEIILRQYNYDKTSLNAIVDSAFQNEIWTAEKISFDAAYNNERMQAYLYLPKNAKPPYQPVIFFPGSGDIFSRKFNTDYLTNRIDFILKSGRALIWPIYKGTHERHDELKSDLQEETVFYKDHVIMWRKDLGRTIDYLETRKDIQADKLGFLGWSWGGFMGGIFPAIEKRIKAVVLNVGGMEMHKALPEADQINFLPRVMQPVLMLNGKHDMFFPIETSQKPMFNFLGTSPDKKKMIVYESGHLVPRTDFVKETLLWYDQYLGPVK